ncbi:hypothetical protein DXN04_30845 [Chitinophaga silvisoli]|uniref:Uncharacterized protein n=1 Tax=Chitinophaga silvisoli TaxID=2291814 RepID=A0A3E1NSR0_9BACT|nr:hypothetical protein DXN04_30845 [Chitinophaga silvisoli]
MGDAGELFLSETPKLSLSSLQEDEIWFVIDTGRWYENSKIDMLKAFCHDQNIRNAAWLYGPLPGKDAIALSTSFKHL